MAVPSFILVLLVGLALILQPVRHPSPPQAMPTPSAQHAAPVAPQTRFQGRTSPPRSFSEPASDRITPWEVERDVQYARWVAAHRPTVTRLSPYDINVVTTPRSDDPNRLRQWRFLAQRIMAGAYPEFASDDLCEQWLNELEGVKSCYQVIEEYRRKPSTPERLKVIEQMWRRIPLRPS
jgi:hypothetical protein